MEPKVIIQALLNYGKGPAIRYAVVAILWAWKGQDGVDAVKAGAFASAAWELAAPLIVSAALWAWGSVKRKQLAEAEPPAKN